MAIFVVLLFCLVVVLAMQACKHLNKRVQIGFIIGLSILFFLLHLWVAHSQLSTIGFAARNRTPNYVAEVSGYLLAFLALTNVGLVFKSVYYAALLLGALIVAFPFMYFLSW